MSNGKRYLASQCNPCHAAKARAYRAANLEKVRARENDYAKRHADQKRAASRAWYAANKERALARVNARHKADPEYDRDKAHQSRAKKAGAPIVEFVRRLEIYERDAGICHLCSEPVALEDFQIDHVIPLCQGGSHTYANVRAAHARCNRKKAYKERRLVA